MEFWYCCGSKVTAISSGDSETVAADESLSPSLFSSRTSKSQGRNRMPDLLQDHPDNSEIPCGDILVVYSLIFLLTSCELLVLFLDITFV